MILADRASQVQADEVSTSQVLIGPCGVVFLRNCRDSVFTIACNQLRTRDCHNCTVYLYSQTDPIIETSSKMTFGPYNASFARQNAMFPASHLVPTDNHWRHIFDFNSKDGQIPQPHFQRMSVGALTAKGKDGAAPTPFGEAKLREAFLRFDKDGDGSFNNAEFNAYNAATGDADELDEDGMREVLEALGASEDAKRGLLSFATFVKLTAQDEGTMRNDLAALGIDPNAVSELEVEVLDPSGSSLGPRENPVPLDAVATSKSDGGESLVEQAAPPDDDQGAASATKKPEGHPPGMKAPEKFVRKGSVAPWAQADSGDLSEGTEVKVNFKRDGGKVRNSDLYSGVVRKVNADGTFAVDYDDGDQERDVQLQWIRCRKWPEGQGPSSNGDDAAASSAKFSVGDEVKGNHQVRVHGEDCRGWSLPPSPVRGMLGVRACQDKPPP